MHRRVEEKSRIFFFFILHHDACMSFVCIQDAWEGKKVVHLKEFKTLHELKFQKNKNNNDEDTVLHVFYVFDSPYALLRD